MGARQPLHAPPPNSAEQGLGAPLQGGVEKVSFAGERRFQRADAARSATLLQLTVLFGFPHAAPGHERALLPRLKERNLPGSVRGGRAHAALSAGVHSSWKFVPGSECAPVAERKAEREAAGPRWARQTSARPRRRWGCCCARCWGAQARPRTPAVVSPPSSRAPLLAAALGSCWTAVASGWSAFPSRSHPGSLGCKYSS